MSVRISRQSIRLLLKYLSLVKNGGLTPDKGAGLAETFLPPTFLLPFDCSRRSSKQATNKYTALSACWAGTLAEIERGTGTWKTNWQWCRVMWKDGQLKAKLPSNTKCWGLSWLPLGGKASIHPENYMSVIVSTSLHLPWDVWGRRNECGQVTSDGADLKLGAKFNYFWKYGVSERMSGRASEREGQWVSPLWWG